MQKETGTYQDKKGTGTKGPPHILSAHTKARDITERFLGLLRAECEKVMLFAQSRSLGELSDTVGSLRFNIEELQQSTSYAPTADVVPLLPNTSNATLFYQGYPLSDGGLHPSASSSSDDGAGGAGTFYWSDSSSNDSIRSQYSNSSPHRGLSAMKDLNKRKDQKIPMDSLKDKVTKLENEAFRSVLRLNCMSHLLYHMNYYVVHPTTITFVKAIAS